MADAVVALNITTWLRIDDDALDIESNNRLQDAREPRLADLWLNNKPHPGGCIRLQCSNQFADPCIAFFDDPLVADPSDTITLASVSTGTELIDRVGQIMEQRRAWREFYARRVLASGMGAEGLLRALFYIAVHAHGYYLQAHVNSVNRKRLGVLLYRGDLSEDLQTFISRCVCDSAPIQRAPGS